MVELMKNIRILICEDVFLNYFILEQLFKKANPSVLLTHAVDGLDGKEQFDKGSFDLIITDIEMPNMNGWEFIRYIQGKSYPTDKIIIISAQIEQMLSTGADQLNVKNYFTKPISSDYVKEIISMA